MKIVMNEDLNISVILNNSILQASKTEVIAIEGNGKEGYVEGGAVDGGYMEGEMPPDMAGGVKDPLLSSWSFVAGITLLTLAISIGIGAILAKLKIKKGIELYED